MRTRHQRGTELATALDRCGLPTRGRLLGLDGDCPRVGAAEGLLHVRSLCQRPHCWYFRQGFGLLPKSRDGHALVPEGENRYHAIFGNSGPAYFVSASILGPALIALGRNSGWQAHPASARSRSNPTRF